MIKTHKIKYDTSKYQFRPLIKKILGEKSLENLHEVKKYERYTEPTDQATMWHKTYYDKFKEEFYPLYKPFTDAYGTNTIWMESEEGKEDFKGYDVSYGEILVFSGPNLLHGNQTNEEKDTRCSIDFRIVHPDKFKTSDKGSVTANVKFKVGGYFEKL